MHKELLLLYKFPRLSKNVYRAAAAAAIVSFVGAMIASVYPIFLKEFSQNIFLIGIVGAITPIFASIFTLIIGEGCDTTGKKRYMLYGILGTAIVLLGFYISTSILMLAVLSLLLAFTREMVFTPQFSLLRDQTPKKSASAPFSIAMFLSTIAILVGPLIAGYIAVEMLRLPFLVGAVVLIFAFVVAAGIRESKERQKICLPVNYETFRVIWKDVHEWDKQIKHLAFVAFSLTAWYSAKWFMGPLFLHNLGFGTEVIGWWLAISLTPFLFLSLPSSKIKSSRMWAAMISGLVLSTGAVLLLGFSVGVHLFILITLIAAGNVITEVVLEGRLTQLAPRNKVGEVTGAFAAVRNVGDIFGKIVSTGVAQFLGMQFAFIPMFILFALSLALLMRSR